ncbi:hypothetical protein NSB25_27590 [Acetatifactor muris]|uniref:Uncharacterized protein n=1 Tax=Acetatifactor muris TaxID=879566 RepID=A0A2K4ZPW1_9FIRM|nr:hypothetical protein [Acetatifactor muris]MCR2050988.1 hypothetical protein [Acetatifactor muris]SOY32510.1 hypothetical protein AMURIS_05275 [Acetatifactor muris]
MKGIIIIKILAGIVLFSAGVAVGVPVCRMYDNAHAEPEPAGGSAVSGEAMEGNSDEREDSSTVDADLQLRVRDGELEWYDGVRWNSAGTVSELIAADPVMQPSEAWQTLAAQLADARAGEYAAQLQTLDRESSGLTVDEIAAVRPQNTSSGVNRPVTPAVTQTPAPPTAPVNSEPEYNDNDDHDDNDDHNDAPAPAPDPVPAPEPDPVPDDTGDGENIEWSGDYE